MDASITFRAMIVRSAHISDAPVVRNLLEQLGYPDFDVKDVEEKILLHRENGYCMLVAEAEYVIGFASLHWFELAHWRGRMGRITSFCIDEKFRSQGIGQQLLAAAEKILLDHGCIKIEVTSNERRAGAHNFYRKAGYAEDSRRFVKYRPTPEL
jgi:GNAT superfamily N-acetyltransferase